MKTSEKLKKRNVIIFCICAMIVVAVTVAAILFSVNKPATAFGNGSITDADLAKIDVDGILSDGVNQRITSTLLTEKGYVISDDQTLSEENQSVWYDCTDLPDDAPLPLQHFSVSVSADEKMKLLGCNFSYAPANMQSEALKTAVSVYTSVAGTDKFSARNGEQFTFLEMQNFTAEDFEKYGSAFQIVNQSMALFLDFNATDSVHFYGYCPIHAEK
ncbi:MAG: hypothetical protein ACI4LI_01645 [Candidatus Fimenecus sp.]